jgi:hypothetical protein
MFKKMNLGTDETNVVKKKSKLQQPVQNLIQLIFNLDNMLQQMRESKVF